MDTILTVMSITVITDITAITTILTTLIIIIHTITAATMTVMEKEPITIQAEEVMKMQVYPIQKEAAVKPILPEGTSIRILEGLLMEI